MSDRMSDSARRIENALLKNEIKLYQAEVEELTANNANLVEKNAFLRQRPDLPVDRIPAYTAMQAKIDDYKTMFEGMKKSYESNAAKVTELTRRHKALQARHLQECHRNRADRIELNLDKAIIRTSIGNLQKIIIRQGRSHAAMHDMMVLGNSIKSLRNLL